MAEPQRSTSPHPHLERKSGNTKRNVADVLKDGPKRPREGDDAKSDVAGVRRDGPNRPREVSSCPRRSPVARRGASPRNPPPHQRAYSPYRRRDSSPRRGVSRISKRSTSPRSRSSWQHQQRCEERKDREKRRRSSSSDSQGEKSFSSSEKRKRSRQVKQRHEEFSSSMKSNRSGQLKQRCEERRDRRREKRRRSSSSDSQGEEEKRKRSRQVKQRREEQKYRGREKSLSNSSAYSYSQHIYSHTSGGGSRYVIKSTNMAFRPTRLLAAKNAPPRKPHPCKPLKGVKYNAEKSRPTVLDKVWEFQRPLNMLPDDDWEAMQSSVLERVDVKALSDPLDALMYSLSNPSAYIANYVHDPTTAQERAKLAKKDYLKKKYWNEFVCHGINQRNLDFDGKNNFEECYFDFPSWRLLEPLLPELSRIMPEVIAKGKSKGIEKKEWSWKSYIVLLWRKHGCRTGLTEFEYFSLIIEFYKHHKLDKLLKKLRTKALLYESASKVSSPDFPDAVKMPMSLLYHLLEKEFGRKGNWFPYIQVTTYETRPCKCVAHIKIAINSKGEIYGRPTSATELNAVTTQGEVLL